MKMATSTSPMAFLLTCPEYGPDLFFNKKNKVNAENSREILRNMLPLFMDLTDWNAEKINEIIMNYAAENSLKYLTAMLPLLFAVSGLKATPGGASDLMALLGKEESIARLEKALTVLA